MEMILVTGIATMGRERCCIQGGLCCGVEFNVWAKGEAVLGIGFGRKGR